PAHDFLMQVVDATRARADLAPELQPQLDQNFGDTQGMYVLGADGTPYGFQNDADASDVLRFLDRTEKERRKKPPRDVVVDDADIAAAWTVAPPPGAQVIRSFSRIRPLPKKVWGLNRSVGRDFLWLYGDEIAALAGGALPPALVGRLLRYHLVD